MKENKKIPPATVKRLPLYLQCLDQVDQDAIGISSKKLAELAKVNDAQVRRDLSYLGTLGGLEPFSVPDGTTFGCHHWIYSTF